jgi:hypothetical protein
MDQPSETRARFLELAGRTVELLEGVPGELPPGQIDPGTVEMASVELQSRSMSAQLMHCMDEGSERLVVLECDLGTVVASERGEFLKSLLAFNLESWPRVLGLDEISDAVTCTWTFQLDEASALDVAAHCEEAAALAARWTSDGFLRSAATAALIPHRKT